ncbi:recombinase family protein [Planomicrobium chinense]|uniref:recombinase family protein n=1 Tax=Planococcus chinensis TaxID=272917 RepID=UPI001CC71198|nr:recombinase family protein [Planococcus chinensis]MBZ5201999.1 recombinase family protein [Planococcus chinensis]
MRCIGYARESLIADNNLDFQEVTLKEAGCETIFKENVKPGEFQQELNKCLQSLNSYDTLIISRLDRLGQTTKQLFKVIEDLRQRQIGLRIVDLNIDTNTPEGKNFFIILEALKEMEYQLLRERTTISREAAKARGRRGGRKPINQEVVEKAKRMYAANKAVTEITNELSISRTTLYKYLKESKKL